MKALETRALFSGFRYDREKRLDEHRERIKTMKKVIDTSAPRSMEERCTSPSKRIITKQAERERIIKANHILAQKIFNIMEGHSDITEHINDTRHIDGHPGTMNFKARLLEAQRIHERNMLLASRLETVQPYYKVDDLTIAKPPKKKPVVKKSSKRSKFARELNIVLKGERGVGNVGDMTHRSTGHDAPGVGALKFSKLAVGDAPAQSQSARKADNGSKSISSSVDSDSRTETTRTRPSNVLLEYTKIQDGRVLDVAVLKEPFRDRYAIFGIDVDDGQRYELRLTSDEVSSILDGDMLVTSVDNVEVWMALLNKVVLQRVGFFARLPFTADEVDALNSNNNSNSATNSPASRSRPPQLQAAKKDGEASDSEDFGEPVPYHYTLNMSQKSSSPPLTPRAAPEPASEEETAVARLPSAPAGARPTRPASRGAGGSAGAVRSRHQQNRGGSGSAAVAAAAADPILSLFAEAGVDLPPDMARTDVATPGFLANATSATVTLVEKNDDFPEPPAAASATEETGQAVPETADARTKDKPAVALTESSKNASRKSAPMKPTSQKLSASTRAASLRAAAVRRKSTELEQAQKGKPVAVHGVPASGMDAEEKAAARAELTKKRLAKEEAEKAQASTGAGDSTSPSKPTMDAEERAAARQELTKKRLAKEQAAKAVTDVSSGDEPAKATSNKPPSAAKSAAASAQAKDASAPGSAGPTATTAAPKPPSAKAPSRDGSSGNPGGRPKSRNNVAKGTTAQQVVAEDAAAGPAPSSPRQPEPQPADNSAPTRPKSTARSDVVSPPARPKSTARTDVQQAEELAASTRPTSGAATVGSARPITGTSSSGARSPKAPMSPSGTSRPQSSAPPRSAAKSREAKTDAVSTSEAAEPGIGSDQGAVAEVASGAPAGPVAMDLPEGTEGAPGAAPEKAAGDGEDAQQPVQVEDSTSVSVAAGAAEGVGEGLPQASAASAATPLEYSMDFENSSTNAEVYKIHE